MQKTLYLWDLANTLFPEKWNQELSGYSSYRDYLLAQGKNPDNPRECEEGFEVYKQGEMFNLKIADGFDEVLTWTKDNESFTTGLPIALDSRAEYLNPKLGYDIKSYFQKVVSTFDFGETNVKTKEMLDEYLRQSYERGYKVIVYTDDKLGNCEQFKQAAEAIEGLDFRIYHILNDNGGLRKKDWYFEIGDLYDLLENEKNIRKYE